MLNVRGPKTAESGKGDRHGQAERDPQRDRPGDLSADGDRHRPCLRTREWWDSSSMKPATCCKARAMRMTGLLRRINESGQRTEQLLRQAAERMEAAETSLGAQFRSEGLLPEAGENEETEG